MSRPDTETYDKVRQQIDAALTNKEFTTKLYQSTNGVTRMINAMVATKGENWAAQVLDEKGQPLLTEAEQQQFTHTFQDHMDAILDFFGAIPHTVEGGASYVPTASQLSGLSNDFLDSKRRQLLGDSNELVGIDDLYAKFIGRIRNVDQVVNNYASKYGILRLEKEQDLAPDVRLIPEPAALLLSQGVLALSSMAGAPIPPDKTMYVLSKIKVPFRTILVAVYIALDVTRISMAVSGRDTARKILTILVSLLELLRGDWKKAILSFVGFFGMSPLLYGELGKIFLTSFRMFSPQLQDAFVFGSLTATKSFLIGILLAIFQITAPEEVRLPLMGALEKVAQHKAKMDGVLESADLPARPEYLSPTFEDLNNLQAVVSDPAYRCSCEFQNLVNAVNTSSIINLILQLLNISILPANMERECGTSECAPFTATLVKSAQAAQAQEEAMQPAPAVAPTVVPAVPPTVAPARRGGRIIRAKRRAMA